MGNLAVLTSLLAVTTTCGDAGGSHPSPYTSLHRGLCTARARADNAAARDVFFDQAQQRFHDLAADAAEHDRAALRLLEAESALAEVFDVRARR